MLPPEAAQEEIERLRRRLDRERATRLQAESIAEAGLRDLYEKQQQIQLLAEIATASNQMTSVEDLLHYAVARICRFTGWEVGHSYVVTGAGNARRLRPSPSWHCKGPDLSEAFEMLGAAVELRCGEGLAGRALADAKPLWDTDAAAGSPCVLPPQAAAAGLRGAGAFPVLSGEEVVAVLEFFAGIVREPDAAFVDLMAQIGTQLGRVIERRRAEDQLLQQAAELRRARDAARAADDAKSAFLANMSHELRTPLNAILGFSEVLKMEMLGQLGNDRYRAYVRHIFDSGTHLLSLINDILDFTRIGSETFRLYEVPIELEKAIAECVALMQPQADKTQVRLTSSLPETPIPLLIADEKRVRQVLFNLLSNAIKFTPENGEARVAVRLGDDGGLAIVVSDTGIGMSAEEIPRAMERFGQIDSGLARRYEGAGLGLPLVKGLMELHGGTLSITSAPQRGTTVTAAFPPDRTLSRRFAA